MCLLRKDPALKLVCGALLLVLVAAPLNEIGHAALDKANGRDLRATSMIPWWRHAWGCLFVAGIVRALWLWHRRTVRWRAENGYI